MRSAERFLAAVVRCALPVLQSLACYWGLTHWWSLPSVSCADSPPRTREIDSTRGLVLRYWASTIRRVKERGPYRLYSDQAKSDALSTLRAVGSSEIASIATGVPRKTLEEWRDSPRLASVLDQQAEIRHKSDEWVEKGLLNVIRKGLDHLDKDEVWAKAGVKDAAIATGIAHTHLRLLRSQPTSITAAADLTSFLRAGGYVEVVDVTPRGELPAGEASTTDPVQGGG